MNHFLAVVLTCSIFASCNHREQNAAAVSPAVTAPRAGYPDGPVLDQETAGGSSATVSELTASGVQTTYSGLKYEVLKSGTGMRPTKYDRVRVNYRGYFSDGRTFDSGTGVEFPLSGVIQGWQEGIPLMKEGAKYRFTVPPHLGYGSQPRPTIPANSTLMFDVDLLEVK